MQSFLLLFNPHPLYIIVIDFKGHQLYALFVIIHLTPSHLLHFILWPT
jgi:hypothetical protein